MNMSETTSQVNNVFAFAIQMLFHALTNRFQEQAKQSEYLYLQLMKVACISKQLGDRLKRTYIGTLHLTTCHVYLEVNVSLVYNMFSDVKWIVKSSINYLEKILL